MVGADSDGTLQRYYRRTWMGNQFDSPVRAAMHNGLWLMMLGIGIVLGSTGYVDSVVGMGLLIVGTIVSVPAQLALAGGSDG